MRGNDLVTPERAGETAVRAGSALQRTGPEIMAHVSTEVQVYQEEYDSGP